LEVVYMKLVENWENCIQAMWNLMFHSA
jgi:hypothetical protein